MHRIHLLLKTLLVTVQVTGIFRVVTMSCLQIFIGKTRILSSRPIYLFFCNYNVDFALGQTRHVHARDADKFDRFQIAPQHCTHRLTGRVSIYQISNAER